MAFRVLCICPFHLPHFIEKARESFRSQTYENKCWMEWDTSTQRLPIGSIRNRMISKGTPDFTGGACDIVAHFDSDDWSSPTRLAEQVAFMQSSGSPVVGYRDMPFYDVTLDKVTFYDSHRPTGYVLGTSLMYRREVWEQTPFPDSNDEDGQWQRTLGVEMIKSQSSIRKLNFIGSSHELGLGPDGPRMVATIHPGNTSPKKGARFEKASAELDAQVRRCIQSLIVAQ